MKKSARTFVLWEQLLSFFVQFIHKNALQMTTNGVQWMQGLGSIWGKEVLNRMWNVKQVAEYLDISPSSVRRKIQAKKIPFYRIGVKLIKFDESEIKNYKRKMKVEVTDNEQRTSPKN